MKRILFVLSVLFFAASAIAQKRVVVPDVSSFRTTDGQENNWKVLAEFGATIGGDASFKIGSYLSVVSGFQVSSKMFIGSGIELSYYAIPNDLISEDDYVDSEEYDYSSVEEYDIFLPVFIKMMYSFNDSDKDHLFVSAQVGYSPLLKASFSENSKYYGADNYSGGLFASPRLGLCHHFTQKSKMEVCIGYQLQKYRIGAKEKGIHSCVLSLLFNLN